MRCNERSRSAAGWLPFDLALCVADSAGRHGVDLDIFAEDAARARGKGAGQARAVARHASSRAANPFESMLRALAIRAGLDVSAQGSVVLDGLGGQGDLLVHPDVVDRGRRLAIEAESWEFHTSKEAFQRDCERYTLLVLNDWTVLRFTWWQVIHRPDWVIACLTHWRARTSGNAV